MRLFVSVAVPLAMLVSTPHPLNASSETDAQTGQVSARTLATKLAARLESDFVYPEQGRKYAAALTSNAAAGKYDVLKGAALAKKLGEDLQSVAQDRHLRVMYEGEGGGGGPPILIKRPADGTASPDKQPTLIRMMPPPIIEHARWLTPGIAFVRFSLFPGEAETTEAARQFMATHADAKTIIFDLRTHMGGGLDEMDAIFPWLFAQPTRLVSLAARKSVDEAGANPVSDVQSLRRVEADPNFVTREHWATPGKDKRLFSAKVYVLTSGYTGSAAEHFALAFKHSKRGTLIGKATYGANHFGGDQDLGGGFTAFIPVGRAYDPTTGKDWEGVGVAPDIDVPAKDALIKALTLSGVSPSTAAKLSAEVAPSALPGL